MLDLTAFWSSPAFSWPAARKTSVLVSALAELDRHHEENCAEYRKMKRVLNHVPEFRAVEDFPFLPVRLFKMYDLRSAAEQRSSKTMTSSGTTGQAVSRIFIDKGTAILQTRALAHILKDFIGGKRLPMIIVDSRTILAGPGRFSARGAGVVGMSAFGRDHFFALNENMELDYDGLSAYAAKHSDECIFIFGFTFMVWRHFVQALGSRGIRLDIPNAVLIHGGGWKKLQEERVDNDTFKRSVSEVCGGHVRVHNFYGLIEQTGSIYMECEHGNLHASNFSQVIIRHPISHQPVSYRERGVVETVSVLPWSYPGHALLTEDLGELRGEDDCPCGRCGRHFSIIGRLRKAELRGCSDTYAMGRR